MDKYKDIAEKRLGNKKSHGNHKTHPEVLAQQAHVKGVFASRVLDEFMTEAYGDILVDYFMAWLQTAPHETKTREFLFSCAMGLGDVRGKLIQKETYGKNIPTLKDIEENNG